MFKPRRHAIAKIKQQQAEPLLTKVWSIHGTSRRILQKWQNGIPRRPDIFLAIDNFVDLSCWLAIMDQRGMIVLAGTSHPELAKDITKWVLAHFIILNVWQCCSHTSTIYILCVCKCLFSSSASTLFNWIGVQPKSCSNYNNRFYLTKIGSICSIYIVVHTLRAHIDSFYVKRNVKMTYATFGKV